jgi:glutathione S-transferase
MTPKITLFMFSGSAPSLTAELMLQHKGLAYRRKHVLVGPHAFGMLARGYTMMTVPAIKVDGRRVQGSREISRALDELQPHPPLFPADPERRRIVAHAEHRGERLQDAARRMCLYTARCDPRTFATVYRHPNPLMRPAQRLSRGLVIRLASAGHRATDRAVEEDVAGLPERLDEIDRWIEEGVLNGPELNAADFQIAPNVALLLRFEDLAPYIQDRPVARLAQRLAPDFPGHIAAAMPSAWLGPLGGAPSDAAPSGPMEPMEPAQMLRAIGYDERRIATTLRGDAAAPAARHRRG